jgi:hypothetical protein
MTAMSPVLTSLNWMATGRGGRLNLTLFLAPSQQTAPEKPVGCRKWPPSMTSIQPSDEIVTL